MDAVIIGGGASGIACALKIKQNNPLWNVTVLEHLEAPLKKIFATGNGRCNITNRYARGNDTVVQFLESLGLVLRESGEGRMYPYSNQAQSVVDVLVHACDNMGVTLVCDCHILSLQKTNGAFYINTDKGTFSSDVLVLATGGKAQSPLGSDGSGYAYAQAFGHHIAPLFPALVQLKSSSKHCRALKGVRTKCTVKIEKNGTVVAEEYGELLFAEYGISGIVTMNLSEHINDEKLKSGEDRCVAVIDFVPHMSEEALLAHYRTFGNFEGILPHKLCSILSRQAEDDGEKMAKYIKNWRLIITGTKGYDYAQITGGGVALDELKATGESALCDGLYVVGELTDRQFPCGGYNLNYALLSGITAADSITDTYDKN